MKQYHFTSLSAAVAACLIAGCSDPSENVHKTSGADPQKAGSASPNPGKEYVIRGAQSTIGFVGSKVTGSHSGGFKNFAGKINADGGKIVGTPEIKINMQSAWSDNPK